MFFHSVATAFNGLGCVHRRVVQSVQLKEDDQLLDIGCGQGRVLFQLWKKYMGKVWLFGIDPNPLAIAKAKAEAQAIDAHILFKIAYGSAIPCEPKKFDCIISTLAMHHMDREEKIKTLLEARRALRPGGSLYIADLGPGRGFLGTFLAYCYKTHSHSNENMETLLVELPKAGFKIVSYTSQWGIIDHVVAKLQSEEGVER